MIKHIHAQLKEFGAYKNACDSYPKFYNFPKTFWKYFRITQRFSDNFSYRQKKTIKDSYPPKNTPEEPLKKDDP